MAWARQWMDRIEPVRLLTVTCLLGWAFKGHCGGFWADSIQYTTGCYSDAVPFWGLRGVAAGQIPYLEARMEYPVLTGLLIWAEGFVTRTLWGQSATAAHFLFVVSAVNALLAFAVLRMMQRAGVDRARLLAWAAAPPLILYVGHNWDMLAITFAVAAMLAARRGAATNAAGLAALGGAAKLFPVLLLPILGLGALFPKTPATLGQRIAAAATLSAAALGCWIVINALMAYAAFPNWSEFYRFSSARAGTAASIWELLGQSGWWPSTIPQRNLASGLLFVAGAGAIVALGWRRHGGAQAWLLFPAVLGWFLLTNKVYSPQFDLWLYPVLLLTSYRLWPLWWFALGDVLAYFAEFWWFAGLEGHHPAATQGDIAIAALIRGTAILWVIGAAVRQPAPAWSLQSSPAMQL